MGCFVSLLVLLVFSFIVAPIALIKSMTKSGKDFNNNPNNIKIRVVRETSDSQNIKNNPWEEWKERNSQDAYHAALEYINRYPIVPYSKISKIVSVYTDKWRHIAEKEFIVIDIETTGLSKASDCIIEVAAIRYADGQEQDKFVSLIKPGFTIPSEATAVNGITESMVRNAPEIEQVLPDFLDYLGENLLVGHNVNFDIGFIEVWARRLGYNPVWNYIDTISVAKKAIPGLVDYKQKTVLDAINYKQATYHRAEEDCRGCAQIMILALDSLAGQTVKSHVSDKKQVAHVIPKVSDCSITSVFDYTGMPPITLTTLLREEGKTEAEIDKYHMVLKRTRDEVTNHYKLIKGPNYERVLSDVNVLNRLMAKFNESNPSFPVTRITELRVDPPDKESCVIDYCGIIRTPNTPTGKAPKYTDKLLFYTNSFQSVSATSDDVFGEIFYMANGSIGKAKVVRWFKRKCFIVHIGLINGELQVLRVESKI